MKTTTACHYCRAPICSALLTFLVMLTACASGTGPPESNAVHMPLPIIDGRWMVEVDIPEGQPHAGRYTTIMSLTEVDGKVNGSSTWSNGANSNYSGSVDEQSLHLQRLDTNGFKAVFDGRFSSDGQSIAGNGSNDPSSPHGNDARYSWWAKRILPPEAAMHLSLNCDQTELNWAMKYVTQPRLHGHPDPQSAATKHALATLYRCSRSEPLMTETLVDGKGDYAETISGSCLIDLNLTISFRDGVFAGASRYEGSECPIY